MNDTPDSSYEMLKAIYDYEDSSSKRTLNFKTDDEFYIYRDVADKESWCLVINAHGELGYVPYTYVKTIYVKDTQVITFLEGCIAVIQEEIDKGDRSSEKFKVFETLMKRQKKFKQKMLHNALDTPVSQNSDDKNIQTESVDSIKNSSSSLQSTKITVPDIYEIVQQVRNHTGLSYNLSQMAVSVVTQYLSELVCEQAKSSLDLVRDVLDTFPPTVDKLPVECLENTKDGQRMQQLLEYLSEAKEDSQQRSWQIYDDHVQIEDCLVKLVGILKNADPLVVNHVLKVDQFKSISNLLDYYQMELRWPIRKQLLEVFTQLCKLNYVVVDIIINSVLPMELAREMQNDLDDNDKKMLLAEFLTLVLSVGETLPIICFDYMNMDFVTKILCDIENIDSKISIDEKSVNCMINLLLSYNLQFSNTESNIILSSLSTRDNAKVLTENLLLLLNTEKDPVNILDLKKKPTNSVVKMLNDMLAHPKVAELFYVNDIEVLVDIVIRCLLNIPAEEESRTLYLELCKNVIFNTNYLDRGHKLSDLNDCLKEISSDDNSCTKEQDLRVINEIYSKYPESFH